MRAARFTSLLSIVIWLASVTPALGNVFSYEANSFPEDAGWEILVLYCDPPYWIENGQVVYDLDLCDSAPPPPGESADYTRSLAEYVEVPEFFMEFRLMNNADRSEMIWGGAAILATGNSMGILYRFAISGDLAELGRDYDLPIIGVDIEPGVLHTYRLELYGDQLYVWYVDGDIVDQGLPEGAFPSFDPAVNIRSRAAYLPNTTWWDYIRYGDMPADGSGDYDSSGTVDATDLYFFSQYFSGEGVNAGPGARWADFDADTDVDCVDWDAFRLAWTDTDHDPPVFIPCFAGDIPAVSDWGVAVMALLVLTTASLVFGRWKRDGGAGVTEPQVRAG